jgi:SAM-dependent methyltransferase
LRETIKKLLGRSGLRLARFLRDTFRAWRHEWRETAPIVPAGDPPVPPARLVFRVAGTLDRKWFLDSGLRAAQGLRTTLADHGVSIEALASVLDFGCGCGRVIRHFQHLPGAIHGCDRDAAAVRWCRRNLRRAFFAVNTIEPPLPYRNEQFGLIYALSVFTHLPASLQQPWIHELARVLAPGGYLVLSIHGVAYLESLSDDERRAFQAGRLVVRDGPPGSNLCAAYHPEAYVREAVARDFSLLDFIVEGATGNPRQDLLLLQKYPADRSTMRAEAERSVSG